MTVQYRKWRNTCSRSRDPGFFFECRTHFVYLSCTIEKLFALSTSIMADYRFLLLGALSLTERSRLSSHVFLQPISNFINFQYCRNVDCNRKVALQTGNDATIRLIYDKNVCGLLLRVIVYRLVFIVIDNFDWLEFSRKGPKHCMFGEKPLLTKCVSNEANRQLNP